MTLCINIFKFDELSILHNIIVIVNALNLLQWLVVFFNSYVFEAIADFVVLIKLILHYDYTMMSYKQLL